MAGEPSTSTESPLPGLGELDLRASEDLVRLINSEDATVPAAVASVAPAIAALADAVAESMRRGGRLIYVGAGSAGRVAALDAYECGPTFGCRPGEVLALVAGGGGLDPCAADDGMCEDDAGAGEADLEATGAGPDDAVVGVSASGSTPYVLAAVERARSRGALTGAVVCNRASLLAGRVEHAVEVLTGPEVIAGSTRMKAASAQKLVLHCLSTVVMVRLGRTFGPFMVAMRPENDKLRRRSAAIVAELTGAEPERCAGALAAAGGDVRAAVVMLLAGCGTDESARLLEAGRGGLRAALALAGVHPFTAPAARPDTTFR